MFPETSILSYFTQREDPRMAILGVIGGADTWVDVER